ncbi:MAG: site-2 protease family protein [Candidatus Vogelbacteria bacterium]|nr:site-2 protease family protein [Candidatus Vogelbacteria bacterium]
MDVTSITFIFSIAVLVMSVVVHEVSHGWMAYILGDSTAKMAGRLTLNPIPHIDPVGSIIVPLVLSLLPGGIVFGWAKPVPYNPYNLQAGKYGPAYVALAGPASNFIIAIIFGLLIRSGLAVSLLGVQSLPILSTIVLLNIMLGLFNLIPVPPLDGSTILFSFFPYNSKFVEAFHKYQLAIILVVIFGAGFIIEQFLTVIFHFLTGL